VGNAQPRLRYTLARLNQWRVRIARSGTVHRFNQVFDTLPSELSARLEGKAITWLNYQKPTEAVRDWGLARAAAQRGEAPEALQAALASRKAAPPVLERHAVVSPTLSRGSVPVSEADMKFLVEQQKVKTIVTLLHPENPNEIALLVQERALAAKYGVKLVNLPLPFGVDPPPEMVQRFLATVDAATPQARVYVHCRLGRDRTGTMVAVFRQARQGATPDAALAEMRQFGFNPEKDTYLQYLANFVKSYMTKGALDLKRFFLRGDAAVVRSTVRATIPAQLPLASKQK
jgi:protein-tyrosine phosphatase